MCYMYVVCVCGVYDYVMRMWCVNMLRVCGVCERVMCVMCEVYVCVSVCVSVRECTDFNPVQTTQ